MASQAELEGVALEVIRMLQRLEQLSDVNIAVIGGLAVWHYVAGRPTENINFFMDTTAAANDIKRKLLLLPDSPFTQPAQVFYYNHGERLIQIDILNQTFSPYVPLSAVSIWEVDALPYLSLEDLIAFKFFFCGIRDIRQRKEIDARDAEALVHNASQGPGITLTEGQREVVENRMSDVVAYGSHAEHWWKNRLNL